MTPQVGSAAALLGAAALTIAATMPSRAADLPYFVPGPAATVMAAPVPVYPAYAPQSFTYGYDPLPVTDACIRKPQPVTDPGGTVIGYRVLRLCN